MTYNEQILDKPNNNVDLVTTSQPYSRSQTTSTAASVPKEENSATNTPQANAATNTPQANAQPATSTSNTSHESSVS
ncbi:MAG: hypothetical protein Fur006_20960 [Coleofasciculaceae cyanobacterium]